MDESAELIETLAARERGSASEGERWAAHWIADRLSDAGCTAVVEEERVRPDTWRNLIALSAAGAAAGLAAARGARALPAIAAASTFVALADDIQNGLHIARRVTSPERATWNVTAECGDPDADRTVVVLAHHDAAHSGLVFHQGPQRALWRRRPDLIERTDTAFPIWWPVLVAHALVAAGALAGRRGVARAGAGLCALATASFADIRSRAVVPGANDNLTAVACLVALARRFADRSPGVRVLLVSAGSEETFQEGSAPGAGVISTTSRAIAPASSRSTWSARPSSRWSRARGRSGWRTTTSRCASSSPRRPARRGSRCAAGSARAPAPTA